MRFNAKQVLIIILYVNDFWVKVGELLRFMMKYASNSQRQHLPRTPNKQRLLQISICPRTMIGLELFTQIHNRHY